MKNKWIWIGAGALALIGGGIAVWYFTKPKEGSASTTSGANTSSTTASGTKIPKAGQVVDGASELKDALGGGSESSEVATYVKSMLKPILQLKEPSRTIALKAGLDAVNANQQKAGKATFTQAQWDAFVKQA